MATTGRVGLESANDAFAITPNDGVDLAVETRQILVGVGGNLTVIMKSGTSVLFVVSAGQSLNIKVTRVMATGTTATGLVGLV